MSPLSEMGYEPEQYVSQQRRPYLPAYGVLVVTEEVRQLQSLRIAQPDFDIEENVRIFGDGFREVTS